MNELKIIHTSYNYSTCRECMTGECLSFLTPPHKTPISTTHTQTYDKVFNDKVCVAILFASRVRIYTTS